MPLTRPSLTELKNQAINEINALVPNADARLRNSVLGVFAKVWAALVDGLYSLVNWLSKQLFINTCTGTYLTDRAAVYGITRLPDNAAAGCVFVQATAGTVIPIGALFTRGDGVQYQTTAAATLPASGYTDIPCIALATGVNGNAVAAVTLNPASPIAGLVLCQVCAAGIGGGAAVEADDALRARVYDRLQNPPGAGTVKDWGRWAKSLGASITRAWVVPAVNGFGTVGVVFAEDNASIVPLPARVSQMETHLIQFTPVGSQVLVYAPTLKAINFTIALTPSDASIKLAVEEELRDLLSREASPGLTIPLSRFNEAISLALGETDHVMSIPAAPVAFAATAPLFEIGYLGTVTWI